MRPAIATLADMPDAQRPLQKQIAVRQAAVGPALTAPPTAQRDATSATRQTIAHYGAADTSEHDYHGR